MKQLLWVATVFLSLAPAAAVAERPPRPLITGLKKPTAVVVGTDGRIYITECADPLKKGSGRVVVVVKGQSVPFCTGLDSARGIVAWQNWLFVVGTDRVWRIDRKGKAEVFAAAAAFPSPAWNLQHITVDEQGTLYVSEYGKASLNGDGAIHRIDPKGRVSLVTNTKRTPAQVPHGPGDGRHVSSARVEFNPRASAPGPGCRRNREPGGRRLPKR